MDDVAGKLGLGRDSDFSVAALNHADDRGGYFDCRDRWHSRGSV